jgi:hypothetical protein
MTRRRALWLVAVLLVVHNLEEALTLSSYLPVIRLRLPSALRAVAGAVSYRQMLLALALATVVPLGVVIWAQARPESRAALWLVLLVQTVLLLNVAAHVVSATYLGGYAPGLVTALALNLPCSLYLLRRALREGWVGTGALPRLLVAAAVVHGPGLLGLIALAGLLVRAS